jgi:homospermidine synthase
MKFANKILCIGFGSVAQCTLPILFNHIEVPYGNVTVIDFEDQSEKLQPWMKKGVQFHQLKITPENMDSVLGNHLSSGDLLIDLAWNIGATDILQWCHDHGVLYINTSVELWDPYTGSHDKHPTERTLYWRHMKIRKMIAEWKTPGPTAIVEHGANPGLISHFAKQGLLDIATKLLQDGKVTGTAADELKILMKEQKFNELAMKLGVKVIHVSERDTQITNKPKEVDEFVNTWSVEGFREEGTTTAELGWGTHEKELPALAYEHPDGPKNQICLARMGMNTWVVSYVPHYCIHGMIIRHGEAFTLSDRLTVWKDGKAIYRPTVHYAYCPCDSAIASLQELRGYDYKLQEKQRILNDEIISGSDILGALIMGHEYKAWWVGSDLSIDESRRLVPHQNATTMQVAISVVAASMWMIDNPNKGFCTPEDLPHEYILKIAKPYLGKWISEPVDWTPIMHYTNSFHGHNNPQIDLDDVWQFKNFLITDGD